MAPRLRGIADLVQGQDQRALARSSELGEVTLGQGADAQDQPLMRRVAGSSWLRRSAGTVSTASPRARAAAATAGSAASVASTR